MFRYRLAVLHVSAKMCVHVYQLRSDTFASLYGLFLAQLYIYFTTYRDHNAIVLIVSFLAYVSLQYPYHHALEFEWYCCSALETMQVAACIHVAYTNLIIDFGNPLKLLTIVW